MHKKFIAIIAVVALIAIFLIASATMSGSSVVMLPSALVALGPGKSLTRVRIAGRVASMPINFHLEPEFELRFFIQDPAIGGAAVPVIYRGLKPDMFAPGRDVIIDGEYADGRLKAYKLMTQCPSKYEPPGPEKIKEMRR